MIEEWKIFDTRRFRTDGTAWIGSFYEISNLGNVKKDGQLLDLSKNIYNGYVHIGAYFLHRVIAELFIGKIPNGFQVDHIDTNTLNNRVDNLRICTQSENMRNPITRKRTGIVSSKRNKGEGNPMYGKPNKYKGKKCTNKYKDANNKWHWSFK